MSYVQTEQAVYRYGHQLKIPYTPTDDDHNAGDVIDLGVFVGVFLEPAKKDLPSNLCIEGVFDFLKLDGEEINLGDIVMWSVADGHAYAIAGGSGYTDDASVGKCVAHSATTDLTVSVLLNPYAASAAG